MLILISDAFDKKLPGMLARFGEVTDDPSRRGEADIICVRSKTKCTKEYIDECRNLKMIIRGGVGLDSIDVPHARSRGIEVYNTAEASTTAVAELAFALMISLPNHIALADASMRRGEWLKKELQRTELFGKKLGILGMGRIGTALAVRARAFRMQILAWHPDVYFSDFAEIRASLTEVLAESDYISVHMPLVDDTRGILKYDMLKHCKRGQYMVNTGRSKVVVESDLIRALDEGILAGYATDVWDSDPPKETKLTSHPKTLCAPHIGASTDENMTRIGIIIERLIGEYLERVGTTTA